MDVISTHKTDSGLGKISQFEESKWQITPRSPSSKSTKPHEGGLVVEDDIEEGTVHVDATIIVQEAQLSELIHEETHP
jgi:hypothetical protein